LLLTKNLLLRHKCWPRDVKDVEDITIYTPNIYIYIYIYIYTYRYNSFDVYCLDVIYVGGPKKSRNCYKKST